MVKITFDEPEITTDDVKADIQLTTAAAKRIQTIIATEKDGNKHLRVSVIGGGCSGFSYNFKLVADKAENDIEISNENVDNIVVIIDPTSYNFLQGSVIDFEETLEASQFVINNPNAKNSCGCGNSFSL